MGASISGRLGGLGVLGSLGHCVGHFTQISLVGCGEALIGGGGGMGWDNVMRSDCELPRFPGFSGAPSPCTFCIYHLL